MPRISLWQEEPTPTEFILRSPQSVIFTVNFPLVYFNIEIINIEIINPKHIGGAKTMVLERKIHMDTVAPYWDKHTLERPWKITTVVSRNNGCQGTYNFYPL